MKFLPHHTQGLPPIQHCWLKPGTDLFLPENLGRRPDVYCWILGLGRMLVGQFSEARMEIYWAKPEQTGLSPAALFDWTPDEYELGRATLHADVHPDRCIFIVTTSLVSMRWQEAVARKSGIHVAAFADELPEPSGS